MSTYCIAYNTIKHNTAFYTLSKMTKDITKQQEKAAKRQEKADEKALKRTAIRQARVQYSAANKAYKAATYQSRYTAFCCLHGDSGELLPEQKKLFEEMNRTKMVWDSLRGKK